MWDCFFIITTEVREKAWVKKAARETSGGKASDTVQPVINQKIKTTSSWSLQITWHSPNNSVHYYSLTHTQPHQIITHAPALLHTPTTSTHSYHLHLSQLGGYAGGQSALILSHRWSARPDQVPPLLWFFPSILWPLEGRALWFGGCWRRRRWNGQFGLKSDIVGENVHVCVHRHEDWYMGHVQVWCCGDAVHLLCVCLWVLIG